MKVCHLSTVHSSVDVRIFVKQCCSLAKSGHDVTLVINHSNDEIVNGVKIKALKKRAAVARLFINLPYVLFYCIRNKFNVYHGHDPELIPILFILRMLGRTVVYDMHENFPKQLLTKSLSKVSKFVIGAVWPSVEKVTLSRMKVVYAETSYKKYYPYIKDSIDLLNMPLLEKLSSIKEKKHTDFTIGYVGGVSKDRYCLNILEALENLQNEGVQIRFECVGPIFEEETKKEVERYMGVLKKVNFYGELPPADAWRVISKCHVGIAMLMPIPNYVESYPTKLFEYLALGLPVLTSNFEIYKPIVEENVVGFCIDPLDLAQFEQKLKELYKSPELVSEMSKKALKVLQSRYSWELEFNKLLAFYDNTKLVTEAS